MPLTTLPTGSIVSYSGPGYYPPITVDLMNATWNAAAILVNSYEEKSDVVANLATGLLTTEAPAHITSPGTASTPAVTEPTVTIPTNIDTASIIADFDTEAAALVADIEAKYPGFIAAHFPNDAATYGAAESWIQGALANPNGGLPVAVQNQITADDHARITLEANRASAALPHRFSAMRFPLMPDQLVSAQVQIEQNKQNLMAESSRKITMQSIDMMKFAVDMAVNLRKLAYAVALDYVKTLSNATDIATKVIGIGIDAQSKLISAVSSLMNARTDVEKLISQVEQFNITTSLDVASKNNAQDMNILEDRLKALLTEAQAIAQMGTSLFNNLHASTGVTATTNA